jgi:hypothetical protein
MMEAVSTFETSVNFYETTQYIIPEECRLRLPLTFRTENIFLCNESVGTE